MLLISISFELECRARISWCGHRHQTPHSRSPCSRTEILWYARTKDISTDVISLTVCVCVCVCWTFSMAFCLFAIERRPLHTRLNLSIIQSTSKWNDRQLNRNQRVDWSVYMAYSALNCAAAAATASFETKKNETMNIHIVRLNVLCLIRVYVESACACDAY